MRGLVFTLLSCLVFSVAAFGDVDTTVHQIIDPAMNPLPPVKAPVGLVAGIVTRDGFRKVYAWGATSLGGSSIPDGDTLFEIASVTKTFTATLLAQAVVNGAVDLDTPISSGECDAKTVSAFCFKGTRTTLLNLATHTAGFPDTIPGGNLDSFSRQDVDGFLSTFRLSSLPGAAYAYSNLGFGLLADLLSDREGESFNQLVHDQIAGPLGMNHTEVTLSAGQVLNPGYSAGFSTLPDFASERLYDFTDQSGLAGAAAVHSTVNDLLTYISDEMASEMKAPFQGDLADAMALSLVPRFSHAPDIRPLAVALGWEILVDHDIIFHSGDLPGFDSFIGFNPITGVGVVILSNTSMYQFDSTTQGGQLVYYDQSTDLGMQILFSQN